MKWYEFPHKNAINVARSGKSPEKIMSHYLASVEERNKKYTLKNLDKNLVLN